MNNGTQFIIVEDQTIGPVQAFTNGAIEKTIEGQSRLIGAHEGELTEARRRRGRPRRLFAHFQIGDHRLDGASVAHDCSAGSSISHRAMVVRGSTR